MDLVDWLRLILFVHLLPSQENLLDRLEIAYSVIDMREIEPLWTCR